MKGRSNVRQTSLKELRSNLYILQKYIWDQYKKPGYSPAWTDLIVPSGGARSIRSFGEITEMLHKGITCDNFNKIPGRPQFRPLRFTNTQMPKSRNGEIIRKTRKA